MKLLIVQHKLFYNLKSFNIVISAFITLMLILALSFIVPWYTYINALNHYHSLMFILLFSFINDNSASYIYFILLSISPYFSPLMFTNLINEKYSEEITLNKKYTTVILYDSIPAVPLLFFVLYLWFMMVYLWFIFIRLRSKQYQLRYYRIVFDNSSLSYGMMWFLPLAGIVYFRKYFIDTFSSQPFVVSTICSLIYLLIVSLLFYSGFIDFGYAIKAYTMKLFSIKNDELEYTNFLFRGLHKDPDALLYNILQCAKKFISFIILTLFFLWMISTKFEY